jgi:WD40 repeat protein
MLQSRYLLLIAWVAFGATASMGGDKGVRTDCHGDPLPGGALARLGTVRLRHPKGAYGVVVSPDGKLLASWGGDETVRLWELATGKEVRRYGGHEYGVTWAAFSPDGKRLASCDGWAKIVHLWDAATGKRLHTLKGPDRLGAVGFSPDGRMLVAAPAFGPIPVWDPVTGQPRRSFAGHQNEGTISADGVSAFCFSPDGKWLVTAGQSDKTIRLWDVRTRKQFGEIAEVASVALAFSPDGRFLASGDTNALEIHVWATATGKRLHRLRAPKRDHRSSRGYKHSLAFSPDGRSLASGGDLHMALWETITGGRRCVIGRLEGCEDHVAFTPDSKLLVSASEEGAIRLWDVVTRKEVHLRGGPYGDIRALAFLADGERFITAEEGSPIRLWDLSSGKEVGQFVGDKRTVESLAVSADGKLLAAVGYQGGYYDAHVWLWNVSRRQLLRRFDPGGEGQTRIAFSPDQKVLAVGRYGQLQLWDTTTGKKTRVLPHADRAYFSALVFSPDGNLLAAATSENTSLMIHHGNYSVRLWAVGSGKELRRISGFPHQVEALAFSPDGKMLLANGWNSDFKLYEVASGKVVQAFREHTEKVEWLAFAPDGRTVASASRDGTVRLWQPATGKEIRRHVCPEMPGPIAYSPDGKRLACGVAASVLFWDADCAAR